MRNRLLIAISLAAILGRCAVFAVDSSPVTTPQSPGQLVTQPQESQPPPKSFWSQDTLTDDWGGVRSGLEKKGITIAGVYEAEVAGSAGAEPGDAVISDGLIDLTFDFDLDRLTNHLLPGAKFHFDVLDIYGTSLSSKYIHDLGNTSNLAGPNGIRLQELWIQQDLGTKNVSLRAGMMISDSEFFIAPAAGIFLNGAFGPPPLLSANFAATPAYPLAAPGLRMDVAPQPPLDFKLAVFAPDRNALNYHHGTDFGIDSQNGALFLMESAYLLNQDPNSRGLAGMYKLGGIAQRGGYASWSSQAANALDAGNPLRHGTNWAVYAVADQQLFKSDPYKIEAFARGGFASAVYSLVTTYFDAGVDFTGFNPLRQKDSLGLGVIRSGIGKHASDAGVIVNDEEPETAETVLEVTYNAPVTPWWTIQPDFQYVVNPGGSGRDAAVFTLRSTLTF